jgi:hypothetical protein
MSGYRKKRISGITLCCGIIIILATFIAGSPLPSSLPADLVIEYENLEGRLPTVSWTRICLQRVEGSYVRSRDTMEQKFTFSISDAQLLELYREFKKNGVDGIAVETHTATDRGGITITFRWNGARHVLGDARGRSIPERSRKVWEKTVRLIEDFADKNLERQKTTFGLKVTSTRPGKSFILIYLDDRLVYGDTLDTAMGPATYTRILSVLPARYSLKVVIGNKKEKQEILDLRKKIKKLEIMINPDSTRCRTSG